MATVAGKKEETKTAKGSLKIGVVHYCVGRTDGVSLEIEKRKKFLEALGHKVKLISGPVQSGADYVIDELEFDSPEMREVKENCFAYFKKKTLTPDKLEERINKVAEKIKRDFTAYCGKEEFDVVFLHNIFALALHLPAAKAFAESTREINASFVAVNHDYYWERKEFLEPVSRYVGDFLRKYVPFDSKKITHISINSLAQEALKKRRGIESLVLGDVFVFGQSSWKKDDFNADFLERAGLKENDLIILQATRIVERKAIEIAAEFTRELEKRKSELLGRKLYNGKIIDKNSDIVLLMAGYAERNCVDYLAKLKNKVAEENVRGLFISELVSAQREERPIKKYSLWDCYVYADMVAYPSIAEGWGNQFIEAVFARKPIALFEYPVFKADIKKEGYSYISLGDTITGRDENGLVTISQEKLRAAADETIEVLTSNKLGRALDKNFNIAWENHDYKKLERFFEDLFSSIT